MAKGRGALRPDERKEHPNWGGARSNTGPRNARLGRRFYATLVQQYPVLPLEYMLRVLNYRNPRTGEPLSDQECAAVPNERVDEMAKAAAPYIHPRLSAVAVKSADDSERPCPVDLSKLTDEELALWERLLLKTAVNNVHMDANGEPEPMRQMLDLEALPSPEE